MKLSDKIYTSLCALFSGLMIIDNLTFQKFVILHISSFHLFDLSVGILLYPFTYLLSDFIAEIYGKDRAVFCVRMALCMTCVAAVVVTGMDHLQATSWSNVNNELFHKVFGASLVAIFSSIVACYTSQYVDIVIYLKIRKWTQGKKLWMRNNGSAWISLFIDTFVVNGLLGVFGVLPKNELAPLIFHGYLFKISMMLFLTPLFYAGVFLLRRVIKE